MPICRAEIQQKNISQKQRKKNYEFKKNTDIKTTNEKKYTNSSSNKDHRIIEVNHCFLLSVLNIA